MLNIQRTSSHQFNYPFFLVPPKLKYNLYQTKSSLFHKYTFIKIITFFLVLFGFALAQESKTRYVNPERPEIPGFPAPSLRIRALGGDFTGIINDLETDVLYFPSKLPFLDSNQIRIVFAPDKWDEKGTANLNLMFPRTFIPRVGLGFQNQLRFYSPMPVFRYYNFSGYEPYLDNFSYFHSSNFDVYQQSIFLSFSITQSFIFAPFYIFVKSPYNEQSINYDVNGSDTLNYHRSQSSDMMNDEITENEFGLSFSLKMKKNTLNIVASLKDGKNQINDTNESLMRDFSTYDDFFEYDSFLSYSYERDSIHQLIQHIEDKDGKSKEQNLKIRWQNETKGNFNLIMDLSKSSTDLDGQVLDTSYLNRWSYYLRRWRYNSNPESTRTDYDSSHEYSRDLLSIFGKREDLAVSLAGGYEFSLDKFTNCFIGLKSVISFTKDSISNINEKISVKDTISQIDSSKTFLTLKVKAINLSIPIGLEYQLTKPVIVRAGITPKFTYEKREYKDEEMDYPVSNGTSVVLGTSFGLGFMFNPRLSIDLYNSGNLFSLGEWLVQGRYRF